MTADADIDTAPPSLSIAEEQAEMIDEFALFDDWMDRYQYLIDLGRKLPPFPEEYMLDEFRLRGCQSKVWLVGRQAGERLIFQATSDAAIVLGLVSLMLRVYSNRTPREILDTPPDFIADVGLEEHLSAGRKNGLASMLKSIRARAEMALG